MDTRCSESQINNKVWWGGGGGGEGGQYFCLLASPDTSFDLLIIPRF